MKIFTVKTRNSTYSVRSDENGKFIIDIDAPNHGDVHDHMLHHEPEVFGEIKVGASMWGGTERPWHTSTVLEVTGL